MIKFIGFKKVQGVSKTTGKNYSFSVGFFINDSDSSVNGSSCFESIISDSFLSVAKIGDSYSQVYYNERKQIAHAVK